MRPMRLLPLFLLTVTTLACAPSCLPNETGGGSGVEFPPVIKGCGEQCTNDILELVPTVIRILSGGERVKEQLDELVAKHGAETVAKAVSYAQHEMRGSAGAQNPDVLRAAARGDDYLKSHGTKVEEPTGPGAYLWPLRGYAPSHLPHYGFVPIERAPANPYAWHLVLASARGARS